MAKTTVIKASELGKAWDAARHVKVEVSVDDLEKLAELRRKREKHFSYLLSLDRQEKEILKKYLEVV